MQTYPSPDDIQQMKQEGIDPSMIADAEETLFLWQNMKDIQLQVESAFANVTLENGIGLWEAQGIDDYKSSTECLALRQHDEKLDWSIIPIQDLNHCYSSLSFFDAEGMRFHLPAFLVADLRNEWHFDLTYYLCESSQQDKQFAMLNPQQFEAVRSYLRWVTHDRDFEFKRDLILQELKDGYWSP